MMGRLSCPDCPSAFDGRRLVHDGTCPLTAAGDRVQAEDRAWFEANPGATMRRRPITPAEVAELRLIGHLPQHSAPVFGDVIVTQLAPGVRSRALVDVHTIVGGGVG
jgi:hypothetical protein